jgi:Lrp/AsnC family leucine-responsive transcriptional regulator
MAMISISMDRHTPDRFEAFEAAIIGCDEILECFLITGQSADYVLKVMVQDMTAFQAFLLGKLTRIPGVTGVHSSFVMRKVIDRTFLQI